MPGGYFRFESTSSGNTVFKKQAITHLTPGLMSINGRLSSDSSWKNALGNIDIRRDNTISSNSNNEGLFPQDLSAQARLIESRRYL